jgi:hypothetical protein
MSSIKYPFSAIRNKKFNHKVRKEDTLLGSFSVFFVISAVTLSITVTVRLSADPKNSRGGCKVRKEDAPLSFSSAFSVISAVTVGQRSLFYREKKEGKNKGRVRELTRMGADRKFTMNHTNDTNYLANMLFICAIRTICGLFSLCTDREGRVRE